MPTDYRQPMAGLKSGRRWELQPPLPSLECKDVLDVYGNIKVWSMPRSDCISVPSPSAKGAPNL